MERLLQIIKKSVSVLLSVAIFFCVSSIFLGCKDNNTYDGELLRLHIRANSNDAADQAVKLKVRDAVNDYIAANVKKSTFDEAYREIGEKLDNISAIADRTLRAHGYTYGAKARLSYEYFPSRMYHDVTVPEGMYDALIIELGSGKGDNWWCVIYPPLCYGEDFKYKSFFAELFG
ncbi:MAG: stage II sporulation protein R [Clostridiales bacterium]|nr:stage II sporulation protein R [Clostridiales bacterium]